MPSEVKGSHRYAISADTASATCPSESVLPILLWPDFSVAFGGYAGWAVNRHIPQKAGERSLRADILQTCCLCRFGEFSATH